MKQKIITTANATVLAVELPEGAKPQDSYCDAILYITSDSHTETEYPIESDGTWEWKLLGRFPDITEEQADEVVEKVVFEYEEFEDIIKYRDYKAIPMGKYNKCYAPITAIKSLYSLLQANEVYFENRKPWEKDVLKIAINNMMDKEAQSKVWDKERTYIFIKVD